MMLLAEAMGPANTRSSLEVMLDAIRRKDEQPKDSPPALPARPASRGRLPVSRRSCPVNFILKSDEEEMNHGLSERRHRKEEDTDHKSRIVGANGLVDTRMGERSPNLRMEELQTYEQRLEDDHAVSYKCGSPSLAVNMHASFKSAEAIDHFLKKDQLSELTQQLGNTNPNGEQLAGMFEEDFVLQQLRNSSLLDVARMGMTHLQFVARYKYLLMENTAALDPLSTSLAILKQCNVPPCMYQIGYTKIFLRIGQLVELETARTRTLQGILISQKYFCGARARRIFVDMKKGATALQSFIRAERARHEFEYLVKRHRAAVLVQKHLKQWIAQKMFAKQQNHIVILQSVIRSWLARKHLNISGKLEKTKCDDVNFGSDQSKKLHEVENTQQEDPLVLPLDVGDFKNRAFKAEAETRLMEEENSSLRKQLQQYEMRLSDYDIKMKAMEQMWQKQMTSLQISLAAAKRNLATNNEASLTGKPGLSPSYPYLDYEDAMSIETYTPEGTPAIGSRASGAAPNRTPDAVDRNRTPDALRNTIANLVKEFEERRQIFEDDAGFIVEVKSGASISTIDPDQEFRKLKRLFASWKRTYKARLRETKVALQKLRNPDDKRRRKWWGKRSAK